jgi:ATP-dependent DNA helicase RecG
LTLDGTWPGNLFDFYRKVIKKLTADLKVPFVLYGDKRLDDTPVHQALREALVNTLVHADFSGRASILVVKRPDMFGFRNPGLMRVPQEIAIQGGESDCRNRLIHQMFRYIGLGEQAGSGIPKIYQGWESQEWRRPLLYEKETPYEQTLLELHTLSLVPEQTMKYLRDSLGPNFDGLSREERLILVTAQIEKTVDHGRMISMMDIHPHDLTKIFSGLTEKGLLNQEGAGRGTIYFRPEARYDDTWGVLNAGGLGETTGGLGVSTGGLGVRSGGSEELHAIAAPIACKKRAPREEVENVLLQLCARQPLTLGELTQLLNRSADGIRKDYLQPLIKAKKLRYKYPTIPNHPEQAYIADGDHE